MRATVAAAAALAACALAQAVAASAGDGTAAQRAVQSYVAMQRSLFDVRSGLYREQLGAPPGPHAWPESQALAATIAVAQLPGANPGLARAVRRRLARLERLRTGPLYAATENGDVYYDDNEWIAQDLLDADSSWPSRVARGRALTIFAGVVGAWDPRPSDPCSGGVAWTTAGGNDDRNTVTTATGALLGLRLYALTGNPALLYWSRRMLAWLDECMLAPDGLFRDHVDGAGHVDDREWSYNQGSAIGAYVELYRTTGDPAALARAESLADDALATFDPQRLASEPPEFATIFFRDVLMLAAVDGRTSYVDAATAYADSLWQQRDPQTGLIGSSLLDQAALVQLYAALSRAGR